VEFNVRRLVPVLVGVCLLALATLSVIFLAAGVHRNDQIDQLRHEGVPVDITVTGCLGLIGGSGSNIAGYACHGTFTLDGHLHSEAIPGNTFYRPGSKVRAVAVPSDPGLLSPTAALATEHSSWRVFILPGILLVVLALSVAGLLLRRRHGSRAATSP
jgi:hypothetical protein